MALSPSGRPSVPWLRELHDELLADARDDVTRVCKVAILMAAHCTRAEIGQRLDLESRDVEAAIRKLRAVRADDRPTT